jgi:hypothetical protein
MAGREKVALVFAISILSVVLTLVAHPIADHFALTPPGTFIGGHTFLPNRRHSKTGDPGGLALEEIIVDVACWFAILSGACWIL